MSTTMTTADPARILGAMQALVCRKDLDVTQRDASDLEFRRLYRLVVTQHGDLSYEVLDALKLALLALVGDDDWTSACHHMADAHRLLTLQAR